MKKLQIELPDALARAIEDLVEQGWFTDEQELGRLALMEFLRKRRLELDEQFQREDIQWARRLKGSSAGRDSSLPPC